MNQSFIIIKSSLLYLILVCLAEYNGMEETKYIWLLQQNGPLTLFS